MLLDYILPNLHPSIPLSTTTSACCFTPTPSCLVSPSPMLPLPILLPLSLFYLCFFFSALSVSYPRTHGRLLLAGKRNEVPLLPHINPDGKLAPSTSSRLLPRLLLVFVLVPLVLAPPYGGVFA